MPCYRLLLCSFFIVVNGFWFSTSILTATRFQCSERISLEDVFASIVVAGYQNTMRLIRCTDPSVVFGTFPANVPALPSLTQLQLIEQFKVSGTLPSSIGLLTLFFGRHIIEGSLSGVIPQEISNLENLNTL